MGEVLEAVKGLSEAAVPSLRYAATSTEPFEVPSVICGFLRPGARVLDIGCGTGATTAVIQQRMNVDIVGIEPNPERAEAARAAGLNVVTGYYEPTVVERHGTFDFIILTDVIEHLENPGQLIEDLSVALRPDGRVLASVPNVAHWTMRWQLLRGSFEYQPTGLMDVTHLRWFTRDSLRRLFERSGFEVEAMAHTAGAWMSEYETFPCSLVSARARPGLINRLGTRWPGLFACQHVVCAKPRRGGTLP